MEIETARRNMVQQQLRGSSVLDPRVLETFSCVRREAFVPSAHADLAFADTAIPLPCGQRMMSPRNEGLLLQSLHLQPEERVLEIGTGSGFLTACMRHLGARIDSLEIHAQLAKTAEAMLFAEGGLGLRVHHCNAWDYRPDDRYDVIVIAASLPNYDPHFEPWLKPRGRLFAVLGQPPVMQARLVQQYAPGETSQRGLFELELDPLLPA